MTDLAELRLWNERIKAKAVAYGLDFYETIFEVLDFDQMNMVAAYDGFPVRYPHWRFGMEYERLRKSFAYGLHKIYEMVINNDPSYAYLLRENKLVDHKIVMAHVYGHVDFFKNNFWFRHTNRRMMDEMANHGARVRRYMQRHGENEVEEFLDRCLSVQDLIDPHNPTAVVPLEEDHEAPIQVGKLKAKSYMDAYMNPPGVLEAERKRLEDAREQRKYPSEVQRDILRFLLEAAPLKPWQADILAMVREESYYFVPQRQTKIMNEGWAVMTHSRILTEGGVLEPDELIDYADHHSGTLAVYPGQINPYKLGVELFRDIEERWNKGQFGREWEECTDMATRRNWDTGAGQGREKIFEVRRIYNDIGFIDTFLTKDFCLHQKMFVYAPVHDEDALYEIVSRDFERVKVAILNSLTNFGQPAIVVEDANFANRGELLLRHLYAGTPLDLDYARDTIANIAAIWARPVHVESVRRGRKMRYTFDGRSHSDRDLGAADK